MARDIWFISDTHFGHEGVIRFGRRPFTSVAEMDGYLADAWTKRVKPEDLIYHLGDVAWNAAGRRLFASLPGTKRLIIGNHDEGKQLAPFVQRILLYRRFPEHGFIASHMPLFMEQGREPVNVHGHVHGQNVRHRGYVNISIEQTSYAPIHLEEVAVLVREEQERVHAANVDPSG